MIKILFFLDFKNDFAFLGLYEFHRNSQGCGLISYGQGCAKLFALQGGGYCVLPFLVKEKVDIRPPDDKRQAIRLQTGNWNSFLSDQKDSANSFFL